MGAPAHETQFQSLAGIATRNVLHVQPAVVANLGMDQTDLFVKGAQTRGVRALALVGLVQKVGSDLVLATQPLVKGLFQTCARVLLTPVDILNGPRVAIDGRFSNRNTLLVLLALLVLLTLLALALVRLLARNVGHAAEESLDALRVIVSTASNLLEDIATSTRRRRALARAQSPHVCVALIQLGNLPRNGCNLFVHAVNALGVNITASKSLGALQAQRAAKFGQLSGMFALGQMNLLLLMMTITTRTTTTSMKLFLLPFLLLFLLLFLLFLLFLLLLRRLFLHPDLFFLTLDPALTASKLATLAALALFSTLFTFLSLAQLALRRTRHHFGHNLGLDGLAFARHVDTTGAATLELQLLSAATLDGRTGSVAASRDDTSFASATAGTLPVHEALSVAARKARTLFKDATPGTTAFTASHAASTSLEYHFLIAIATNPRTFLAAARGRSPAHTTTAA